MRSPQQYIQDISLIVGDNIADGDLKLDVKWKNYAEGKAALTQVRAMQKELRLLKRDLGSTISGIKSQFITSKASVGKGVSSALAGFVVGKRAVGKFNTLHREALRRSQIHAVQPYDDIKRSVDHILHGLDTVKTKIELSPEYQIRESDSSKDTPPPLPPEPPISAFRDRFYVYLGNEVKGPFSVHQLQALKDTGMITSNTPCCAEGEEVWWDYSQVIV